MALLTKLTRFYKNESSGLPHDSADLWELGWKLASILEQYGLDEWKGFGLEYEEWLAKELRTKPDVVRIDTAVNLLHWAVLHSQAEGESGWEQDFKAMGRDVVQYLLHRTDA